MRTIKIKHVGPVKKAGLELKKINLLIGSQSTGKSTIAKIVCYCTWVEKEICQNLSPEKFEEEGYFEENLVVFHKMKGFITEKSYIEFETDVLSFKFSDKKFTFNWKDLRKYKRIKTLYIPAERNIVAVIPNWFEVNLERNNTRSFLADWERVRKYYSQENPLKILDLAQYYYNENSKTDNISYRGKQNLSFNSVSSGFQTITPLLGLFHYYSELYYNNNMWRKEENIEFMERVKNQLKIINNPPKTNNTHINQVVKDYLENNTEKKEFKFLNQTLTPSDHDNFAEKDFYAFLQFIGELNTPNTTAFFIEEPELNLYPETQRSLMNQIITSINKAEHTIFITTHSPYLLTSMNNLMYAAEVGEENESAVNKIIPKNRWVDKKDVAAWKIDDRTFELHSLLDEEIAMLKAEEIDDVSNIINNEFDSLFDISHNSIDQNYNEQV